MKAVRPALVLACAFVLVQVTGPQADILSFQQGDGGAYSTTDATFINFDTHVNFGSYPSLYLFAFDPDPTVVSFIRFPQIIGPNTGQIPPQSVIVSATLELARVIDCSATTTFHEIYTAWDENTVAGTTWTDVAGTDYGASLGSMSADYAGTVGSVDITTAVQGWSSGGTNLGLLLRPVPGTVREARYHSDDAADPALCPRLTVEFTPPPIAVEATTWGKVKALYR